MQTDKNPLGQPVGPALPGWKPPQPPQRDPITGRYCRLVPLSTELHARALYEANSGNADGSMWTYMAYGPFDSFESYRAWTADVSSRDDPLFYAIIDNDSGKPVGVATYMRIDAANGVIEVGNLAYSPLLQRKRAATEAMYLMMEHALAAGYRRYEWKCNALNAPSRAAAQRLGFSFEGVFRQAQIVKGRSRDTAWYSVIDKEWPALKAAYLQWLAPANFDEYGKQRQRLSDLTAPILKQRG